MKIPPISLGLEKAAEFGAMMGKRAAALTPTVLSSLAGAAIGGGGTAIYDWLKGTKENKLRRALIGVGVGGLAGAGIGHFAGKTAPASSPDPQPSAPTTEKRVPGIGDLKDFGEDNLAASRDALVANLGRKDPDRSLLDDKSLRADYLKFRSLSTSNALSKNRDRLLYDPDFFRKALASPADEPEDAFESSFYAGNNRRGRGFVDYRDDGLGRLYRDRYYQKLEPMTYTPALTYKLGPWEGSGDLTNRFFLPAGREDLPSGAHKPREIKTMSSRPGDVK